MSNTTRPRRGARHAVGFTLLELIYVITIAGVVLGLGVPALEGLMLDARRIAATGALVAAARLARNEAQKRGSTIALCASADGQHCSGSHNFAAGWAVLEMADGSADPAAPAQRLHVGPPAIAAAMIANRTMFEFRPFPRRSTNGTIEYCDPRGTAHSRAVIVSYSGRPRIAAATAHC